MTFNAYSLVMNGDHGLTILFKQPTNELLSRQIITLANICQAQFEQQLEQIIPAYQSLTLSYLPNKISYQQLTSDLRQILSTPLTEDNYQSQKIIIPVCYQLPYAIDLAKVAEHCQLTEQQVVERHCNTEYFVHMLGFSPGFLYLGGLNPALTCPRKTSPELSVAAGSVGIGGAQTGIYPQNSPGGWHIIGRTPISLFDIGQQPPCVANPLDRVKFTSISGAEFEHLSNHKQ